MSLLSLRAMRRRAPWVLALVAGPGLALAQSKGAATAPKKVVPAAASAVPSAQPPVPTVPASVPLAPASAEPPPGASSPGPPATEAPKPDQAVAASGAPALSEKVGETRWTPGLGFVHSDEPPARDARHPRVPAVSAPSAGLLAKTGTSFAMAIDVAGVGYVHLEPPGRRFGSAAGFQLAVFGMEGRWHVRSALLSPWFKFGGGQVGVTMPERTRPEWNPPRVSVQTTDKFTAFLMRTNASVGLDFAPWDFLALGPMGQLWVTYTQVNFDYPGSERQTNADTPKRGDTDYGPGYGVHGRLAVPNGKSALPWVYLDSTMTWRSGRYLKSQDLALQIGTFAGTFHGALRYETRLGTSGGFTYDFWGRKADASNLGEVYAYSMPADKTVMVLLGVAVTE
jgi:hypothetical protein